MSENDKLNIPAFVIGLKNCPERWQPTVQKLSELGINARYWQAVDGTDGHISLRRNEKLASPLTWWLSGYSRLNTREIGCFLSHYRLWQYAISLNLDRVAIYEDDVIPLPGMRETLIAISALDESYGMVHLGDPREDQDDFNRYIPVRQPAMEPLPKGRKLVAASRRGLGIICTHGYVVTRNTLLQLVKRAMPIFLGLDIQLFMHCGIRTFIVMPSAVDSPDYGSAISNGSTLIVKNGEKHNFQIEETNRFRQIYWGLLTYRHLNIWMQRKKNREYLVDAMKYLFTQRFPLNPDGQD